ncbi:MAG: radical SAM protein [Thermodesulfobacteriota bacterium]|nr:radical SAM protein [Thermodesulfobacteriota bacterium]
MANTSFWVHPPKIIQWDSTSKCNLKCKHCRASNLEKVEKDLSLEESTKMFSELNKLAPEATLALAGGEPMMRKDLRKILQFIKNNTTISVEMLTNATLIDKSNIDWLCDLVNGFNISLEGSTAEIHDTIRGKGAFKRTLDSVDMLVEKDVPISIRMTYFEQGEDEVKKLMELIYDHGVRSFNFRYIVPVGNAYGVCVNSAQYEKITKLVWDWGKELNMTIGYSDPFPELFVNNKRKREIDENDKLFSGFAVTGCSVAFSLLYINPNGIVQFCPYFPVVVDDIKTLPVEEIWYHNEKFNLFRQSRSFLKGECGKCKYKFACGGCRGAAYASGDYLDADPRCWMKNIDE